MKEVKGYIDSGGGFHSSKEECIREDITLEVYNNNKTEGISLWVVRRVLEAVCNLYKLEKK